MYNKENIVKSILNSVCIACISCFLCRSKLAYPDLSESAIEIFYKIFRHHNLQHICDTFTTHFLRNNNYC